MENAIQAHIFLKEGDSWRQEELKGLQLSMGFGVSVCTQKSIKLINGMTMNGRIPNKS